MSLARCLGVDDLESPLLAAARAWWRRWSAGDVVLAVVEELDDLPAWTRQATKAERNAVLARLAAWTTTDVEAVTALVWLLVPGAVRVADALRDLHPDIDGLVAGQLWIEAERAYELGGSAVAATILRRTQREVAADLGVGDLARRRDRSWAEVACVEQSVLESIEDDSKDSLDPVDELMILEMNAMNQFAIHTFDAILIDQLSWVAAAQHAPAGRGRMGLTTPAVVDEAAKMVHLSPRAIRRRAAKALDHLAEFARVWEDPDLFPIWRAQHPSCAVTPAEELHLVIDDDGDAHFFRIRDLPPGAYAPDLFPRRQPPSSA